MSQVRDRGARIRRRRFCLTLNNPTEADRTKWRAILASGGLHMTFFVVQTERGADNNTLHYQAYVEFSRAVEWSAVRAIFGDRISIQNSRGSGAANIKYCTKEDTRVTEELSVRGYWGTPKAGGGATMCAIALLGGATVEEVQARDPGFMLMNMQKVHTFAAISKGSRKERPKINILFGSTGCGKSMFCKQFKDAYWVAPPTSSGAVWFGLYFGQEIMIFDDFGDNWFQLTYLLRLFDSTPLLVAPKGAQVPLTSKEFWLTTNVDPVDWFSRYQGKQAHKDALQRRLAQYAKIYDCRAVGTPRGRTMVRTLRTTEFRFRSQTDYGGSVRANSGITTPGNSGWDY